MGKGRRKVDAEMLARKGKIIARETIFLDEVWQVRAICGLLKENDWNGAFVVNKKLDAYNINIIISAANSRQLTAYAALPHYEE
ncbi:hypothetical protein Pyn_19267 [Prunus yedoensis var. nudiflora]|uniref:Uncharacterized protein n=1 Tax=Prunus yedoensis var. nudiflora TaxID=2094558 RepID=A0A314YTM5_PRUYE|nr:hypothetical protein Pyn_19267 [Prunus yedoensis var. nudiflora]